VLEVGEGFPVEGGVVLVCFWEGAAGRWVEVGVVVAGYDVFVFVWEGR
jgi:hypothetical protein